MAESGKIYPTFTHIEIDERGRIWCIQNHFESDSVIMEMESSSKGDIIDDGYPSMPFEYYEDDDFMFGDDYL